LKVIIYTYTSSPVLSSRYFYICFCFVAPCTSIYLSHSSVTVFRSCVYRIKKDTDGSKKKEVFSFLGREFPGRNTYFRKWSRAVKLRNESFILHFTCRINTGENGRPVCERLEHCNRWLDSRERQKYSQASPMLSSVGRDFEVGRSSAQKVMPNAWKIKSFGINSVHNRREGREQKKCIMHYDN
jgi:hypothetical protein